MTISSRKLGMTVENVLERTVVRAAAPGGGAEAAGVETGSLLVALDGMSMKVAVAGLIVMCLRPVFPAVSCHPISFLLFFWLIYFLFFVLRFFLSFFLCFVLYCLALFCTVFLCCMCVCLVWLVDWFRLFVCFVRSFACLLFLLLRGNHLCNQPPPPAAALPLPPPPPAGLVALRGHRAPARRQPAAHAPPPTGRRATPPQTPRGDARPHPPPRRPRRLRRYGRGSQWRNRGSCPARGSGGRNGPAPATRSGCVGVVGLGRDGGGGCAAAAAAAVVFSPLAGSTCPHAPQTGQLPAG